MQKLGTIKHVQIQREPLKQGDPRQYSPSAIYPVDELRITPTGLVGLTSDGAEFIDAHNSAHPQTRNRDRNAISFGFTGHYAIMKERFGNTIYEGAAGENIIVEGLALTPDDVGSLVAIQRDGVTINLIDVHWAPPCVEFSQFVANRILHGAEQKEVLQFLSDGRRGYYATAAEDSAGLSIFPGDILVRLT